MGKIINLEGNKDKWGGNTESVYDRALRKMTAEDYKMIEELFNN